MSGEIIIRFSEGEIDPNELEELKKLLAEHGFEIVNDLSGLIGADKHDGIIEEVRKKMLKAALTKPFPHNPNHQNYSPEDLIEETGVVCKIPGCGGIIVKEYYIPYIPDQFGGENMVGFGSENVATIKNKKLKSVYCNHCMNKYEKVPKD